MTFGWRVHSETFKNLAVAPHVVPEDDLREHDFSPNCWCRPRAEDGVVVHNSLDGREFYERGERRLS